MNQFLNSNGGSGTKRSGNYESDSIPRKHHKTAKDSNGSKTGSLYKKSGVATTEGNKKKHCDLCAKFFLGNLAHTILFSVLSGMWMELINPVVLILVEEA